MRGNCIVDASVPLDPRSGGVDNYRQTLPTLLSLTNEKSQCSSTWRPNSFTTLHGEIPSGLHGKYL
jgi:hypothetical protein